MGLPLENHPGFGAEEPGVVAFRSWAAVTAVELDRGLIVPRICGRMCSAGSKSVAMEAVLAISCQERRQGDGRNSTSCLGFPLFYHQTYICVGIQGLILGSMG